MGKHQPRLQTLTPWPVNPWCLRGLTAKWPPVLHYELLCSLGGGQIPTMSGRSPHRSTGGLTPMLLPSHSTSNRMDTHRLAWERYSTRGNDDIQYSWSVPYFHSTNKVYSVNAWHCFDNASDDALQDGQTADKAVETLQEIKQNRSKGIDTPFFLAVGFHKPHLPFFAPSKYCEMYPEASDIALAKNPSAPSNMPPIAWSTSSELRSYIDMAKYNLPECRTDAAASMKGTKCHIADADAEESLLFLLKLHRRSNREGDICTEDSRSG